MKLRAEKQSVFSDVITVKFAAIGELFRLTSITVGIALACTPASRRLQYISQVDGNFKEIALSYQLKEDKTSS